jgi:hypothetical protein
MSDRIKQDIVEQPVQGLVDQSSPNQAQLTDEHSSLVATGGAFEFAGRRYVTADRLASILGITVRTLSRWGAAGCGPPKIKTGKLVLFDLDKFGEWLSSRETQSTRATAKR